MKRHLSLASPAIVMPASSQMLFAFPMLAWVSVSTSRAVDARQPQPPYPDVREMIREPLNKNTGRRICHEIRRHFFPPKYIIEKYEGWHTVALEWTQDWGDKIAPEVKCKLVNGESRVKRNDPVQFSVKAKECGVRIQTFYLLCRGRIRAEFKTDSPEAERTFAITSLFKGQNTIIAMARDNAERVDQAFGRGMRLETWAARMLRTSKATGTMTVKRKHDSNHFFPT